MTFVAQRISVAVQLSSAQEVPEALGFSVAGAWRAVNLEPPSRRQEISGPWEINPYKFVSPIY